MNLEFAYYDEGYKITRTLYGGIALKSKDEKLKTVCNNVENIKEGIALQFLDNFAVSPFLIVQKLETDDKNSINWYKKIEKETVVKKDAFAENKHVRNSYVAHVPQSLNAMVLNKAFLKVFYEIAMHPTHSKNFKLLAQIHDSILFQFRVGHSYLCKMVQKAMEIPVTVKGYDGVVRTFTVPAAIKAGPDGLGSKYWSDTE